MDSEAGEVLGAKTGFVTLQPIPKIMKEITMATGIASIACLKSPCVESLIFPMIGGLIASPRAWINTILTPF